jgi:hypothetical protein
MSSSDNFKGSGNVSDMKTNQNRNISLEDIFYNNFSAELLKVIS